jgi:hypothetical protein
MKSTYVYRVILTLFWSFPIFKTTNEIYNTHVLLVVKSKMYKHVNKVITVLTWLPILTVQCIAIVVSLSNMKLQYLGNYKNVIFFQIIYFSHMYGTKPLCYQNFGSFMGIASIDNNKYEYFIFMPEQETDETIGTRLGSNIRRVLNSCVHESSNTANQCLH